ncbi:hypothetical protein CABS01_14244 [Colletotrichum abscissum]|uniref:Uncharacterized protein n=1 Tax=Colletotrichum abscissum TaxID=1671311 RepID=A0A9P9X4A2_9PEZI|nr:uncharacterized protein CABS01_14244 [Colletotrichum abscissum]KAI3535256.1 hypothetical protein CABS02_13002 [Colletotrichum abscissum]KAK1481156.1 hypothetical protein CABS01_14244 [Colletotrichum abscissum]
MSHDRNETYMLAPNWNFRPGGPIKIGNIIFDPFRPDKSEPEGASSYEYVTETANQKNYKKTVDTTTSLDLSIWLTFLANIKATFGANHRHVTHNEYTMDSLQTTYLLHDPLRKEIQERCNDPDIKRHMKLDSLVSKPVYMITGLRIAKGFRLQQSEDLSKSAQVGIGVPVSPDMGAGGDLSVSTSKKGSEGFESVEDIIYSYQLSKIHRKGLWDTTVVVDRYFPKALKGPGEAKEAFDIESSFPDAEELQKLDGNVQVLSLNDGEIQGTVVFRASDEDGYPKKPRYFPGCLESAV